MNGSISYTVGQMGYTDAEGNGGSLSSGIQYPYEISLLTDLNDKFIVSCLSVFPNPTTDYIQLIMNRVELIAPMYQLYDIKGRMVLSDQIISNQTTILTSTLKNGTYLLKILDTKLIKTFKIVKK
ncbi:MAG: T9SS type A sorting domain-containing protein [Bacteroidales bacterium]|nr:T9SS type A sorting domain-containing protein [Bacteroidales bacterium]